MSDDFEQYLDDSFDDFSAIQQVESAFAAGTLSSCQAPVPGPSHTKATASTSTGRTANTAAARPAQGQASGWKAPGVNGNGSSHAKVVPPVQGKQYGGQWRAPQPHTAPRPQAQAPPRPVGGVRPFGNHASSSTAVAAGSGWRPGPNARPGPVQHTVRPALPQRTSSNPATTTSGDADPPVAGPSKRPRTVASKEDEDEMSFGAGDESFEFNTTTGRYERRPTPPPTAPRHPAVPRPGPSISRNPPPDTPTKNNLRAEVEALTSRLSAAKDSISSLQTSYESTRGEVSIVRSALNKLEASSKANVAKAKAEEDRWRKRVEELERELGGMKKAEQANRAFRGIEESAKKMSRHASLPDAPPGSVRRLNGAPTPSILRSISRTGSQSIGRSRSFVQAQVPPTTNGASGRPTNGRTTSGEIMPPPLPPPRFGAPSSTAATATAAKDKGKGKEKASKAFGGFQNSFAEASATTASGARAASRAPASQAQGRPGRVELELMQVQAPEETSPSRDKARRTRTKSGDRMIGEPAEADGFEEVSMEVDSGWGNAPMDQDSGVVEGKKPAGDWEVDDDEDDLPHRDLRSEILSALFQHSTTLPILPAPVNSIPPPPVAAALAAQGKSPLPSSSSSMTTLQPTLHYLLNLRHPEPPAAFAELCQDLFGCLGSRGGLAGGIGPGSGATGEVEEEEEALMGLVVGVGKILVKMAEVLAKAQMLEPLRACLSLLSALCHLSQLFPSLLLNHPDLRPYLPTKAATGDGKTAVAESIDCIALLCSLVSEYALPEAIKSKRALTTHERGKPRHRDRTVTSSGPGLLRAGASRATSTLQEEEMTRDAEVKEIWRTRVLDSVLELIEALCWDPSEACFTPLDQLLGANEVVENLLHLAQPPEVVRRGVGILTLLGCHVGLFRSIMRCPMDNVMDGRSAAHSVPLIDQLAKLLSKVDGRVSPHRDLTIEILTLLTMLSVKHNDAPVLLAESVALVPVLVAIIYRDVQLLSDGDGGPGCQAVAGTLTRRVDLAVALLHYLVHFRGPDADHFRSRIFDPNQSYPGAHHHFIVAFTRLAYADAPDWLTSEDAERIDGLTGLAHDLLMSVASPIEIDQWYDCVAADRDDEEDGEEVSEMIHDAEAFQAEAEAA